MTPVTGVEEPRTRAAYGALAVLTGLNLLNYFDRYLMAAVLPRVQQALTLSNFQAGLVGGAFMLGYCTLSPVFGWLGDRGPRRRLIALAVAAWSLATAGASQARGFLSLFALRSAVGVGEAGYATLSPALIDDLAPPGRTNRWLAVFYVAIPVGSAMGYALGGALEARVGWRMTFLFAGLPGLALAALAARLPEPARRGPAHPFDYRPLLRSRPYLLTVGGYIAYTFALGGFAFWAPKFLVERFPISLARADFIFGAVTASAGLLGTALGGLLAERWPGRTQLRRMLGFSAMSSALAAPAAFMAVVGSGAGAVAFFFWIGLAELLLFASTAPVNTALIKSVPEGLRASAMAASIFAIHVGGDLISPPAIGALADRVGLQTSMVGLPIAIVLSGLIWWIGSRADPPAPAAATA
jgi:MFS transporter, Spinster family, sphingosine-1-phosphate transporter